MMFGDGCRSLFIEFGVLSDDYSFSFSLGHITKNALPTL